MRAAAVTRSFRSFAAPAVLVVFFSPSWGGTGPAEGCWGRSIAGGGPAFVELYGG